MAQGGGQRRAGGRRILRAGLLQRGGGTAQGLKAQAARGVFAGMGLAAQFRAAGGLQGQRGQGSGPLPQILRGHGRQLGQEGGIVVHGGQGGLTVPDRQRCCRAKGGRQSLTQDRKGKGLAQQAVGQGARRRASAVSVMAGEAVQSRIFWSLGTAVRP